VPSRTLPWSRPVVVVKALSDYTQTMLRLFSLLLCLAAPVLSAEIVRVQLHPLEDYDPRGRRHAEVVGTSSEGDVPLMNFMDAQVIAASYELHAVHASCTTRAPLAGTSAGMRT
jgi:hypothetical protein